MIRKIDKIIALLTLFALLLPLLPAGAVSAAGTWDNFTLSEDVVENSDGSLTLTSTNGTTARAQWTQPASSRYEMGVSVKVEQYSNETGICIGNGQYRTMMYIRSSSLYFAGGSAFNFVAGTDWHDYYFVVEGDSADIYVDDVLLGTTTIQENSTRWVNFWVKSASGATASMKVSDFTYRDATVKAATAASVSSSGTSSQSAAAPKEPTAAFHQDFTDLGDWKLAGEATIVENEETGKDLKLYSITAFPGIPATCTLNYVPTDVFNWHWRMKADQFGGDIATRVYYGSYQIYILYFEDYLLLSQSTGENYRINTHVGYDWHDYRLEVDNGFLQFYLDGEITAALLLPAVTTAVPNMYFYVRYTTVGGEAGVTVDFVDYEPIFYNLQSFPLDGSQFPEGEAVSLRCNYTGEMSLPYVDYVANGVVIGQGAAPGYEFVWENAPYGSYRIQAVYGDVERSRPIHMDIVHAFGGKMNIPQVTYGEHAIVTTTPFHSREGMQVESVTYLLNNEEVTQTNREENFAVDFGVLPVGRYNLQAIVMDSGGARLLADDRELVVTAVGADAVVGMNYDVFYSVEDAGAFSAGDGMFRLNVRHTPDALTCDTAEGEVTVPLGTGTYQLAVRSGYLEITRNGHLEQSFLLPQDNTVMPTTVEGLSDLQILPGPQETLIQTKGPVKEELEKGVDIWSLEFEKEGTQPETIELGDGNYHMSLKLNQSITVTTAPLGDFVRAEEIVGTVPEGRHFYRITMARGIGLLYIDNEYVGSMRLPQVYTIPYLFRENAPEDALTILHTEVDSWTFTEDFEDTKTISPERYWDGSADIALVSEGSGNCLSVDNGIAVLNGYIMNPVISARVKVAKGSGSGMWVVLRQHTDYAHLTAGYNFTSQCWEIRRTVATDHRVLASAPGTIPIDEWFDVQAIADEQRVTLLINGRQMVTADNIGYRSHGRVGFMADGRSLRVDDMSVTGDGRIAAGMQEMTYPDCQTTELMQLEDGSILMMGFGNTKVYKSTDDGATFQGTGMGLSPNTIRLQNGNILSIRQAVGSASNLVYDQAWIYASDATTLISGPHNIQTWENNRTTMNNKLMQTSNGRIVFCAGELGHGQENSGALGIYYSDDGGVTWHESKNRLTTETTGNNPQEGKVVELPDGTLRCYIRTDRGFLHTSDSKDNGVTWDLDLKKTQFITPLCAFNIERDPTDLMTYYLTWEFNNTNESGTTQIPRYRVGLAVSYDGCETWEYVADVSGYDLELDGAAYGHRQYNHGIRIIGDYVYVNYANAETMANADLVSAIGKLWRIEKDLIRTQKRFPLVQVLAELEEAPASSQLKYAYIQSTRQNTALMFGEKIDAPAAEKGLISAAAAATYLGASLTNENGVVTLSASGVEAVFRQGSAEVSVNGEPYTAAVACNGPDGIPADAVAAAFHKELYQDDNYVILSTQNSWSAGTLEFIDTYLGISPANA